MHKLIKDTLKHAWVSTETPVLQAFFQFALPGGECAKLEVQPLGERATALAMKTGATQDGVIVQMHKEEAFELLDEMLGEKNDGANKS